MAIIGTSITPENSSEIRSLTAESQRLSTSVDRWNDGYMWFGAVALIIAFLVFTAQFLVIRKGRQLNGVQTALLAAKDRQLQVDLKGKDEQIERVKADADEKNAILVARAKEADARIAEAQRGSAEAAERAKKAQASLALAEQHSSEANAKAEGFRLGIAKANEAAAIAQAQVAGAVAEAAKANLELERLKRPRSLSAEQQSKITAVLKQFPGQKYSLTVDTDPEALDFMGIIESLLKEAGWVKEPPQLGDVQVNGAGTGFFSGVFFDVSPDEIEKLHGTIRAVADVFTREGVPSTPRINNQLKGKLADMINIGIGKKP